jgi:hypothetical protein
MGERAKGRKGASPCTLTLPLSHTPVLSFILALLLGLTTAGCSYYSFTGATIPSRLNTIAVPLAQDNSVSPVSTLDEDLTQFLISRFVDQTRLSLETTESNADAVLTATIQRYTNQPTAVSGDERATLNRVTIQVDVTYVDQVEDQELLQRQFSSFEEYDPVEDGLDGEQAAARAALENIAEDIFSAATSNW